MRIGLIRHFPVEERLPSGWKTATELHVWRQKYDNSPAIPGDADLGSFRWNECMSSDLERAVVTARVVFGGTVEKTTLLREPDFAQFRTGDLRLPVWAWRWILMLAWLTGHKSQRACRDEFRSRVIAVADLLERRSGDILIVSHAGMMTYLSAELRARGFTGPRLRIPEHATLYVYERNSGPRLASSRTGNNETAGLNSIMRP